MKEVIAECHHEGEGKVGCQIDEGAAGRRDSQSLEFRHVARIDIPSASSVAGTTYAC